MYFAGGSGIWLEQHHERESLMTVISTAPSANGFQRDRLDRVYDLLAQIDPDDLRQALLAITEGAPLQRSTHDVEDPGPELPVGEGGAIELDDLSLAERVVGINNQLPVHFLEEGVVVQKAVARVKLKVANSGLPAGSGWGTGSLVSPSLLLTNNHVIPTGRSHKVAAEFNYQFDFGGADSAVRHVRSRPDLVLPHQRLTRLHGGARQVEAGAAPAHARLRRGVTCACRPARCRTPTASS